VCVYLYIHIYTPTYIYIYICFHDREGRYDQEQGICIMVSILGIYIYVIPHFLCNSHTQKTSTPFVMTKSANSWDVTSASVLYLSELNLTVDDDFTNTSSEAHSWIEELMTSGDIDIILHLCTEVEFGKFVPCQEYYW